MSPVEGRGACWLCCVFISSRVEDKHGNIFHRLAALETRGAKRASFGQMLYLPAIFFAYGVLLGERMEVVCWIYLYSY